ncbi:hypothetical protein [Kordiimonas laminariae]|uniref:hypothetical protein n=1 Tax=Kordiimonas laminariae TaxID=2917717 RepID=UPI001FF2A9ED|nr:hypothetical protein [Kordiimonas laminariae]MCK0068163.1 hypothetical protein [Kordiimonas laminariae]
MTFEASEKSISAGKLIEHVFKGLLSGQFGITQVIIMPLLLMFGLYYLFFYLLAEVAQGQISVAVASLGFIASMVGMFIVLSRLYFNLIRIFLLGRDYATFWDGVPIFYNQQTLKQKQLNTKGFGWRFFVFLLVTNLLVTQISNAIYVFGQGSGGSPNLLVIMLGYWFSGMLFLTLAGVFALPLAAKVTNLKDSPFWGGAYTKSGAQRIGVLQGAFFLGLVLMLPTLVYELMYERMLSSVSAFSPLLLEALFVSLGGIWRAVFAALIGASVYTQLFPDLKDEALEDEESDKMAA